MLRLLLSLFLVFGLVQGFALSNKRLLMAKKSSLKSGISIDEVAQTYHSILAENALLADMVTVLGTTTLSDFIAQSTERSQKLLKGEVSGFDATRLARFAVFGFMDGAVGHNWFILLDNFVKASGTIAVVEKIALDTLVYTPVWCVWFVVGMSLLKQNWDVVGALKSEWKELAWIDLGFFFPLSCIVYSVVPLVSRVTVFAVASVVYTVIVSLWNEQKKNGGKSFMTDIVDKS